METKIDIENIIKDKKSFKDWFIEEAKIYRNH
jgi:hypothetical protein